MMRQGFDLEMEGRHVGVEAGAGEVVRVGAGFGAMPSLIWLTLGAFAIGTEGFMIAGLLPSAREESRCDDVDQWLRLSDRCSVKASRYDGKSSEESNANGLRPASN